jgi:hypothetical protein
MPVASAHTSFAGHGMAALVRTLRDSERVVVCTVAGRVSCRCVTGVELTGKCSPRRPHTPIDRVLMILVAGSDLGRSQQPPTVTTELLT